MNTEETHIEETRPEETQSVESPSCVTGAHAALARRVAPEDIVPGMYAAVMSVRHQYIAWWRLTEHSVDPLEVETYSFIPCNAGEPVRVREVCLPFVCVSCVDGEHRTLDVRLVQLARLDPAYGKNAMKRLVPEEIREKRREQREKQREKAREKKAQSKKDKGESSCSCRKCKHKRKK
ncbi:MAG: hypothetical protein H6815_07925 [Phycisphaeraceae bacterium]|nr:hypothetical protein [Phycisphaerales bacterium]MCB9860369.1 hypothetical protein [Phycisphaeraceae bacterium]